MKIIRHDDITRELVVDYDGVVITLSYPEDITTFEQWSDVLNYAASFQNLADNSTPSIQDNLISPDILNVPGEWI